MRFLITLGLFVFGFIVFISVYLQPNSFSLCPMSDGPVSREGCNATDAIVAVSGGDTMTRTAHAVSLYKKGWAPLLVFSGAAQDKSGPSNAVAMRAQAIAAGVPAHAILVEENSENTQENARNTVELFSNRGIREVILVTSGYHQRRASLEFGKKVEGLPIEIQNSPTSDRHWNWHWWTTPRGWWLALTELGKIVAFYAGVSK